MTRPKVHVKKGDKVLVIAGKDGILGKKGKVLEVSPKESKVIVEGVNVAKKHTKPNAKKPQGGIVEKEAPIASSNVMLICNKCSKPTRIGKKILDSGKTVRACKKCGEVVDK
ncbi:MAG: 50S ribosomal protein L24 [Thermincolia bacterium]